MRSQEIERNERERNERERNKRERNKRERNEREREKRETREFFEGGLRMDQLDFGKWNSSHAQSNTSLHQSKPSTKSKMD